MLAQVIEPREHVLPEVTGVVTTSTGHTGRMNPKSVTLGLFVVSSLRARPFDSQRVTVLIRQGLPVLFNPQGFWSCGASSKHASDSPDGGVRPCSQANSL